MRLLWNERAWAEYLEWQRRDKRKVERINRLLKEIMRDPSLKTIGKVERLRGSQSGACSARVDQANRLVYKVDDDVLIVLSCKGHYE